MHMSADMHITNARVFSNAAFMTPPDKPIDLIGIIVYTTFTLLCQEAEIQKRKVWKNAQ